MAYEKGPATDVASEQSRKFNLQKLKGNSLLILLSVIWGLAFVAIRELDFQLSPINLTLIRWFIASAGYLVLAPFLGKPKRKFESRDLPRLLVISLANVPAYHLSLNYGETRVSSGLAGLLVSLGPVFIVLLSALSLKEKIGSRLAFALGLAVLGAIILSISQLNLGSSSLIGMLAVIVTAFSYALFAVLSKPLVSKYGAISVAIWAGTIGTVMLLPLVSMNFITQVSALSVVGWLSILYLSLLSTVFGYMTFFTLLSRGAVSKLSIQLYLIPIVSVIGGALLLGETITVYTIAGGGALLIAVSLATRAGK